jgi:hypothetical protein
VRRQLDACHPDAAGCERERDAAGADRELERAPATRELREHVDRARDHRRVELRPSAVVVARSRALTPQLFLHDRERDSWTRVDARDFSDTRVSFSSRSMPSRGTERGKNAWCGR